MYRHAHTPIHLNRASVCLFVLVWLEPSHSPSCRWVAAAGAASSADCASCPYSACSETRRGWPAGSGPSSPRAAPSWARRAAGSRCSTCAKCAAASRWAPCARASSSRAACARAGATRAAAPRLALLQGGKKGQNVIRSINMTGSFNFQ